MAAVPLPVQVICEMLDVPVAERLRLRSISKKLLLGRRDTPGRMRKIADAIRAMDELASPPAKERIENLRGDLISLLAQREIAGLYTRELVHQNVEFLIIAGHETSINLTANGLVPFAQHPDEWALLASDPDR